MIVVQFILWIIGFLVKGFSLYQVMCLIPIICFSIRKFGVKISCGSILTMEILFLFFSTVSTLLFSEIQAAKYIISLILRILSILVIVLDDTMYVYVTEERKVK